MKKLLLKKIGLSLFVVAATLLWTTCEVGLGESVDNFAPSIAVTGPVQASICKGAVTICGTCSDDKGVMLVSVTVKNTTTGAAYPFSGNINMASRTVLGAFDWSTTINQMGADGRFPLPDGKYVADVTATDVAGRVSGVSSTSFDIDNTPPVFCVTSPKSLVISGSKVYGRSVTISGEIADDHDIEKMEIKVYKTDANGDNPVDITGSLAKTTFTDFETAGGTTIYIAKYFDNEPQLKNPDGTDNSDHDLWLNYNAIYGGAVTDTNKNDDMYIYIVPILTDKAGNTSKWSYISTEVKKRVAEVCGVDPAIDSLQTGQLQKIYNGTYTLGELNPAQQAAARKVLNGDDAKASTYFCGVDPKNTSKEYRFAATVNSNNSPTYAFGEYKVPVSANESWQQVNTQGNIAVTLKAGRDGWGIFPNTLRVNLYESDNTGAKGQLKFSSESSKGTKDPSGEAKVFVKTNEGVPTKNIETSVTNQSYYVSLPALKAGDYYLLEAEGIDENDSDLVPADGRTYGLKVSQSINPPTVTATDLFYIAGAGAKSSSDFKFRINIKDESDSIQDADKGLVIDAYLYDKHISSKAYIGSYTKPAAITRTITGDAESGGGIAKDSDNIYHADLAIGSFGFNIANDKNYTIVLDVKAKYKNADGSSIETTDATPMIFWVDNTAPAISLKSPDKDLIDENFSSYETNGTKTYITPNGIWSDIEGSGTHRLWYTTSDDETPALEWTEESGTYVKGTNYYEKQATDCYVLLDTSNDKVFKNDTSMAGYYTLKLNSSDPDDDEKTWTEIADVSQVASQTNWDKKIEVSQGAGKFRVVGVDAVGNISAPTGRTGLKYDFEAPKIVLTSEPASNGYYNLSNADSSNKLAISFVATDSYKINASGVTVTAAKNGAAASSGYTLDIKQAKNSQGQDDPTKVIVTITLTAGGSSDGKWKFTVNAKDVAGRDAAPIELERIVDTVKPAFVAYSNSETNTAIRGKIIAVGSGDKSNWTYWDGAWYSVTGLVFNGNITEATSGIKKIYYRLSPADGTDTKTGDKSMGGAADFGTVAFALPATGFAQSVRDSQSGSLTSNNLYIWAEDVAGNLSDETSLVINVDQSQPNVAASWYTYAATPAATNLAAAAGTILSDGTKAMTVYGTVSSDKSGVAGLDWQIAGSDATNDLTSLEYTTDLLTDSASFIKATWAAIPANADYAITGWKAVIPKAKVLNGDVFVTAKNKAQKTTKAQIFTIDRDQTAPKVFLNTPDTKIAAYKSVAAGTASDTAPTEKPDGSQIPTTPASVNGKLKISGNASDDKNLEGIKFYWAKKEDSAPVKAEIDTSLDTPIDLPAGSSIYNWTLPDYEFSKLNSDKTKFLFADGTEFSASQKTQTVYIKAAATDKAQNSAVAVYEYSVNPDSDRPVITFTLPGELKQKVKDDQGYEEEKWMSDSNYIIKTGASVLRGKVEDDDGLTGLKLYYSDNGGEWKELALASGAFEIFNDNANDPHKYDGKHTLLFKVVDAKETTFVTGDGTGSNNSWLRPKIHKAGSGDAETFFGGDDTGDSTVYIMIDTEKPKIDNKAYFVDAHPDNFGKTNEVGNAKDKLVLLGGARDKFTLYFYSKDTSGLDEDNISFVFNGVTYKKTPASGAANEKALTISDSTSSALSGYSLITVPNIAIPNSLPSGSNYEGTIKVKDKAGMENIETITIEIDNDAPGLDIIKPSQSSNQTVSGKVTAQGSVTGVDNETKLYYALSYKDDTYASYYAANPNYAATIEPSDYTEIIQKSKLMWYVYFDGGASTDETHADTLNQYLIDNHATINGVTATASTETVPGTIEDGTFKEYAGDDGVLVYLWIKAIDAVGNIAKKTYTIRLNPQGKKPTVSFSYPSSNEETVGGEFKFYGGAETKDKAAHPKIEAVFAQIISKAHEYTSETYTPPASGWGTLDTTTTTGADGKPKTTITAFTPSTADLDYLKAAGYTVVKMRGYTAASPKLWNGSFDTGETAADYAVLANVSGSSWSIRLNSKGEFDPKEAAAGQAATTNTAAIRVYSYDGANFSVAETRAFVVDSDTPQLKDFMLEQFGEGGTSATATASREYEDDIYVTGKWYLTFKLTDGQGLGVVKIGKGKSDVLAESAKVTYLGTESGVAKDYTDPTQSGTNYGVVTRPTASSGYGTLNVKYPLDTNESCGTQYVYVYYEDTSGKGGSNAAKIYKISYDNKAPELAKVADEEYGFKEEDNKVIVRQKDGWYRLSSKVSEPDVAGTAQSGFKRLAFYFKRGNEIFDPMIKKGADGNRIPTADLGEPKYGLYWKSATVGRDKNNLNALTLSAADKNIHKGGLVEIRGVIYRIDDLSTDEKTITLDGQPKVEQDADGNAKSDTALFAIANVVDSEIGETPNDEDPRKTADYGFGYNEPSPDDGDLMVESIIQDNTDYRWNASIYSKNIADGPVTIHYVAFDKAGNWAQAGGSGESTDKTVYDPPVVSAIVSNNAPRIANVYVGTDLNGDNKVGTDASGAYETTSGEWSVPYNAPSLTWNQDTPPDPEAEGAFAGTEAVLKGEGTNQSLTQAYLTAKGMTVVRPEILGGNGKLYYSYKISDNAGTSLASGNNPNAFITSAQTIAAPMQDETGRQGNITIQVGDFTSDALRTGGIPDCAEESPHKFEFTFYDQTEDATGAVPVPASATDTAFFNAAIKNTAKVTVYMAVSMGDDKEPEATREPLFWKGAGATDDSGKPKNSVAWDDETPLGHIELGDDQLPEGSPKHLPSIFNGAALAAEDAKDGVARDATLMDRDSKVSGKIVLRGTVSDTKMLYRIYLKIPAMAAKFTAAKTAYPQFYDAANAAYGYIAATYNAASGEWTTPVGTATTLGNYGIKFAVKNNKITPAKHSADWEFVWDTSYIDTVAATDITVDVRASDQVMTSQEGNSSGKFISLDGSTEYTKPVAAQKNVSGSTAETAGNMPATLRLDVVPYITGLTTFLSKKGVDAARTAKGHWPVGLRKDATTETSGYKDAAGTPESFTVNGFNIIEKETDANGNITTIKYGQITKTQTTSGWLVVESGADDAKIPSLNNINNNDAYSATDYDNAYNRQPNGKNNNLLTDDVYIDVWQFNGKVADVGNNEIASTVMKINPASGAGGLIGFAFKYGDGYNSFAMPDGTTNSYRRWQVGRDEKNSIAFAFDSSGRSYGTSADSDSGKDGTGTYADFFALYSSVWRPANQTAANVNGINAARIEMTGAKGDTRFVGKKFQSPSIATAGSNVYLAYYDAVNEELRFRSSLKQTFAASDGKRSGNPGNFVDKGGDKYNLPTYDESRANCQIVAAANSAVAKGGSDVCIAAIPGTSEDTVVMVWHDGKKMWYSFNTTPNTNRKNTINPQDENSSGGWSKPYDLFVQKGFANAGKFCKVAVDGAGHVHIAAYGSSGYVCYAYVSDPEDPSEAVAYRVDSGAGQNLTLDVALKSADGGAIPYIGYYSSGKGLPKIARLVSAGAYGDGVTGGKYTGTWELSFVPSQNDIIMDNMNVGVWKDADGVLASSTAGDSYYGGDSGSGKCYGNGKDNAVMGYTYQASGSGATKICIETAQLTGDPTKAY